MIEKTDRRKLDSESEGKKIKFGKHFPVSEEGNFQPNREGRNENVKE